MWQDVGMTQLTAALFLVGSLIFCGCSATRDDIQQALDDVNQGLEITNKSLKVTSDLYKELCARRPDCRSCKGKTAETIRALLEMGPLTVGQIQDLLQSLPE